MQLDPHKLADQQSFIQLWKEKGARGTLVAVTGYGKTTVGILAIQQLNARHPERTTHVVVPTLALKKQWETHISRWGLVNVGVFVINSYVSRKRFAHLLVLDEVHRYGSRTFSQVFRHTSCPFILGLTATIERQDGMHSLIEQYAPVLRTISLDEALQKGYVSKFMVFNLGVGLTEQERQAYEAIQQDYDCGFAFFECDFNTAMRALKDARFRNQYANAIGSTEKEVQIMAVQFMQSVQKRKAFLNEVSAKIEAVKQIHQQFNRKMIVFAETTEVADKIADCIGPKSFAYHTAVTDKKQMKKNLDAFRESDAFNAVAAVKSIEEGLDVPDLEMAVLVSGNSTKRQYIQRMGRSLRPQPGKTAIIINIFTYGTQDESWLRRRQYQNDVNIQWVQSISQISAHLRNGGQAGSGQPDQYQHTDINDTAADRNPF